MEELVVRGMGELARRAEDIMQRAHGLARRIAHGEGFTEDEMEWEIRMISERVVVAQHMIEALLPAVPGEESPQN